MNFMYLLHDVQGLYFSSSLALGKFQIFVRSTRNSPHFKTMPALRRPGITYFDTNEAASLT